MCDEVRTSRARGRAGLDARLRVWQRSERLCDVADRVRQLTSSLSNPGGRTFKRSNHGNRHFSRQYDESRRSALSSYMNVRTLRRV